MDCLEFRRRLLQDPFENAEELLQHESDCSECAHFSTSLRRQENSLRALLNSPSPPPELVDNIRLGTRLEPAVTSGRRVWLAAAASVILAVGVSMTSLFTERYEREHMALAQSVIHHIEDEANHLREPGPATPGRVQAVLARFGAKQVGDLGQIRFAAECVMRNRTGVHLVVGGKRGPVTVFFMPGESAPDMLAVESDRFNGSIYPMPWGSLAVIGEKDEFVDPIAIRMQSAVKWPQRTALTSDLALNWKMRSEPARVTL